MCWMLWQAAIGRSFLNWKNLATTTTLPYFNQAIVRPTKIYNGRLASECNVVNQEKQTMFAELNHIRLRESSNI